MSGVDIWLLVLAAGLVVIAGLFSSAEAALSSFSKARAEEISNDGRRGAARLLTIVEDPPRYLNTALFLRMLNEICAIILVTVVMLDLIQGAPDAITTEDASQAGRWWAILASLGVMLVVSFVMIGVAPQSCQLSTGMPSASSTTSRIASAVTTSSPRFSTSISGRYVPSSSRASRGTSRIWDR